MRQPNYRKMAKDIVNRFSKHRNMTKLWNEITDALRAVDVKEYYDPNNISSAELDTKDHYGRKQC